MKEEQELTPSWLWVSMKYLYHPQKSGTRWNWGTATTSTFRLLRTGCFRSAAAAVDRGRGHKKQKLFSAISWKRFSLFHFDILFILWQKCCLFLVLLTLVELEFCFIFRLLSSALRSISCLSFIIFKSRVFSCSPSNLFWLFSLTSHHVCFSSAFSFSF